MGTLVCRIELNKENKKGVTVTVENSDGKITQTFHMDGTAITTTVKGNDETSTITQKQDSVVVKCKDFTVDAETITCKSSKDTLHDCKGKYTVKSTKDCLVKSQAKFTAQSTKDALLKSTGKVDVKATKDFTAKGMNATVQGQTKATLKGGQCVVQGQSKTDVKGAMVNVNASGILKAGGNLAKVNGGSMAALSGGSVMLG